MFMVTLQAFGDMYFCSFWRKHFRPAGLSEARVWRGRCAHAHHVRHKSCTHSHSGPLDQAEHVGLCFFFLFVLFFVCVRASVRWNKRIVLPYCATHVAMLACSESDIPYRSLDIWLVVVKLLSIEPSWVGHYTLGGRVNAAITIVA